MTLYRLNHPDLSESISIEKTNKNENQKFVNNVIDIILEKYSIILDESVSDDSLAIGVAFLVPLDNLNDTSAELLHAEIKVSRFLDM